MNYAVLSGKRILVTGGAGFIGSRLVQRIISHGGHVSVVDNLSVGLPMPPLTPALTPAKIDIRDGDGLTSFMTEFAPDIVVHLAAVHHIPTCETRRAYALDVNIVGTETVLAACEQAGVKSLVMASTGAVYAWTDDVLNETSALGASDNYSIAKLANETQGRLWAERSGGRLRLARIFNTIGTTDPNAHLIPDILDQIPPGTVEVTLQLGNLEPRRDYIFVDDTAAGIAALACDDGGPQIDVFNISTGVETSVGDLVRMIGAQLGATLTITRDTSRVRRIDRMSQVGDASKAAERLGWRAEYDVKAAVAAIIGADRLTPDNR